METEVSLAEMVPGDHNYVWRELKIYAHHGIYVGKAPDDTPMVIHFVAQGNSKKHLFASSSSGGESYCSRCTNHGERTGHGVHKCCLECFLQSSTEIYRYQYGVSREQLPHFKRGGICCRMSQNGSESDVISRAEYLVRHGGFGDYNLFEKNCETFAVYCKTKRIFPGSAQVQGFFAGLLRTATFNGMQVDWHDVGDQDNGEVVEVENLANYLRNRR